MKTLLTFFVLAALCPPFLPAQNTYTVEGSVLDAETAKPLPGASIRVTGTRRGTYTSPRGTFRLPLPAGQHRVSISSIGYERLDTTLSEQTPSVTIRLRPSAIQLGNVEVTGDISADEVIRRAIRKKQENQEKIKTFEGLLYSKFVLEVEGNVFGQIEDQDRQVIMETFSRVYRDRENDQTAVHIVQRRQTANIPAASNLLAIGNFVSFYDETLRIVNTDIPSPLAEDAFSYYAFTLKRRVADGSRFIYVIDVRPTTTLFPAFEGTLSIVEGSYDLIEAELAPSEATSIAYVRDLKLHQKFEEINSIWLPTFLHITGRGYVNIISGFAEIDVPVNVTSIYTEVTLNQPLPDTAFGQEQRVTVATDADSSRPEFWQTNSLSTLTEREKEIYERVDSAVANTPKPEEEGTFSFAWSPLLAFNRVGGVTGGAQATARLAPLALDVEGGYSFGLERSLGRAELALWLFREQEGSLAIAGEVFSQLSSVPVHNPYPRFLNTVYTALLHTDYNDYLREDGWAASLSGSLSSLSLAVEGRFSRHFCQQNTISYSVFSSSEFRPNPVFRQGNYRTLRSTLGWGNYGAAIIISNSSSLDVDAEISGLYGEETQGGTFRSIEGGIRLSMPTFYTGYIPMSLVLNLAAGKATGDLPPQFQFVLGRRMPVFGRMGHFVTAPIGYYGGSEFTGAYAEHNCSDFFWRLMGLPTYEGRGLELILEGGSTLYRGNPGAYFPTGEQQWYSEVGFALGKIPTFISNVIFLRLDALWGVGPIASGRFGMAATISSPF